METWKDVEGYAGLYQVSDQGRIRSLGNNGKKARIMRQEINENGYCRVRLYNAEGTAKHWQVHRLVARAFIDFNPELEVNHKNEIKTDNRADNLEMVTGRVNRNYGTRNERIARARKESEKVKRTPVAQIDKRTGEEMQKFSSALEADRQTGVDNGHIGQCCRGIRKSAGGYKWEATE